MTLSEFSGELAGCRLNINNCNAEAFLYERTYEEYKSEYDKIKSKDRVTITKNLNSALKVLKVPPVSKVIGF